MINKTIVIITDILDFGSRSIKTLDLIELGLQTNTASTFVRVYYRYSYKVDFAVTDWVTVNSEGIVNFPIAGLEFKIAIKNNYKVDFRLHNIICRVKFNDKRGIRGIGNANSYNR